MDLATVLWWFFKKIKTEQWDTTCWSNSVSVRKVPTWNTIYPCPPEALCVRHRTIGPGLYCAVGFWNTSIFSKSSAPGNRYRNHSLSNNWWFIWFVYCKFCRLHYQFSESLHEEAVFLKIRIFFHQWETDSVNHRSITNQEALICIDKRPLQIWRHKGNNS